MSSNSKPVWLYCAATFVLTIVAVVVFRATLYMPLKKALGYGPREWKPPHATMDDVDTQSLARQRFEETIRRRDLEISPEQQEQFARIYHSLEIWQNTWYLGHRIWKNPCDLWMMQQIMFEVQPDYIIEAGTMYGGSAIYFAHIFEGLGLNDSKILTFDILDSCQDARETRLWKKHVEFFLTSSTDPEKVKEISERVKGKKVLVVLDSDHSTDHVFDELMAWGPVVSPGSYIVVEDTNLDGVPVSKRFIDNGPMKAVDKFLSSPEGAEFETDVLRESMLLTFNPGGWLKKKDPDAPELPTVKDPSKPDDESGE